MRAGFLVTVVGLVSFGLILLPEVPVAWAVPTFAVAGFGMGLGYAPLSLIVLREAMPGAQGTASSALSLSDTLGTALGTGISGAIIAASLRATDESQAGLAVAFRRWSEPADRSATAADRALVERALGAEQPERES